VSVDLMVSPIQILDSSSSSERNSGTEKYRATPQHNGRNGKEWPERPPTVNRASSVPNRGSRVLSASSSRSIDKASPTRYSLLWQPTRLEREEGQERNVPKRSKGTGGLLDPCKWTRGTESGTGQYEPLQGGCPRATERK
jgi:hypothetical protein